jgi:hypothetical protein
VRAVGDREVATRLFQRMMLVECLRQIALTKADPDVFLAGIKDDLISRAKQTTRWPTTSTT